MNDITGSIRFYKPSGAFSPAGVVLTLVVGAAVMVPAAFVYCFATRYIPLIYVNVIVTYVFGALAGGIVVLGAKRFGIRSVPVAGAMGFLLFLVGYIVHWPAFLAVFLAHWEGDGFNIPWIAEIARELLADPEDLVELAGEIMAEGTWSLGNSDNSIVRGPLLAAVWVAEALVMLYAAVSLPLGKVRAPYSERKGEWIKEEETGSPIPYIADTGAFLAAMARRDFTALTVPAPTAPDDPAAPGFARVSLYPDDRETYVTVTNVQVKRNKKGKKLKAEEKKIVSFMTVDNTTAGEIRTKLAA